MFNLFGTSCHVSMTLDTSSKRKCVLPQRSKKVITDKSDSLQGQLAITKFPLFSEDEDVTGSCDISVKPGKSMEHQGIRVELIGQILVLNDSSKSYDFFSMTKDLAQAGVISGTTQKYAFVFQNVDKQFETFIGSKVHLRYFVRLTVQRSYNTITKECDFVVQNFSPPPEINAPLKLEVGIEDFLHLEFAYEKSKFHLRDVLIGKIHFLLVRIRIKRMDLDIIQKEIVEHGPSSESEASTIFKYEVMDGAPAKGESIPVRFYLSSLTDLTPTYSNVQNRFSVKYYVSLVLVDAEDRRYFKQQEIQLFRKKPLNVS